VSGLLAGKVWQSDLHPDLKPLAAALADIGNDDGTSIYPSVEYMAWLLGRSTRSVQGNLSKLRSIGVLVIVSGGKGGRRKTTEYRLVESALPTREKWAANHAISSWFRPRNRVEKPRTPDPKPRSLRQETTNLSSPDPLVEPPRTKTTPPYPPAGAGGNGNGHRPPARTPTANRFTFVCRSGHVIEVFVPIGRRLWRNQKEGASFQSRTGADDIRGPDADAVMQFFKLKGYQVGVVESPPVESAAR
jgi:hypothetical protein